MSAIILCMSRFNRVPSRDALRRDAISSFMWVLAVGLLLYLESLRISGPYMYFICGNVSVFKHFQYK